jgi:hypothetical protein
MVYHLNVRAQKTPSISYESSLGSCSERVWQMMISKCLHLPACNSLAQLILDTLKKNTHKLNWTLYIQGRGDKNSRYHPIPFVSCVDPINLTFPNGFAQPNPIFLVVFFITSSLLVELQLQQLLGC